MQGFGVNTYRFVNADNESVFVKFHWNPMAGTHSLVWDEAVKISGADPDFHRRDLWEAIEAGAFPEYELGVQIITEEQAERFTFDVLDATKIVPEEVVPVRPVGGLVLNRHPDNGGRFRFELQQMPRKRLDIEIERGRPGVVLWVNPGFFAPHGGAPFGWTAPLLHDEQDFVSLAAQPVKESSAAFEAT